MSKVVFAVFFCAKILKGVKNSTEKTKSVSKCSNLEKAMWNQEEMQK